MNITMKLCIKNPKGYGQTRKRDIEKSMKKEEKIKEKQRRIDALYETGIAHWKILHKITKR